MVARKPLPPPLDEPWIKKTLVFLLSVQVVILILDVIFNYLALVDDEEIMEMFNVSRELSIGNWFSSVQEAAVGILFWLIFLRVRALRGSVRDALGWALCAGFFVYLGLDDGVTMHERVSTAIGDYFTLTAENASGRGGGWLGSLLAHFPSYEWQVLFGPFIAAMGLYIVVFVWRNMERKAALQVFFGFVLFAIAEGQDFIEGLETPYTWLTEKFGTEPYTVPHFMKMGEEYLEMLGATVVLWVLLRQYAALERGRRSGSDLAHEVGARPSLEGEG